MGLFLIMATTYNIFVLSEEIVSLSSYVQAISICGVIAAVICLVLSILMKMVKVNVPFLWFLFGMETPVKDAENFSMVKWIVSTIVKALIFAAFTGSLYLVGGSLV